MAKAKKKTRSAAQKAATKKMLAANRAKRAGKKKPAAASVKRRKTRKKGKAVRAVVKNKAAVTRARRSRPKAKSGSKRKMKSSNRKQKMKNFVAGIMDVAKGGAVGGAAALGLDVAMGNLPLPDKLKTGAGGVATRVALSIVAGKLIAAGTKNHQIGRDAAVGMLSTTIRDSGRSVLQKQMPTLQLGELADLSEAIGDDEAGDIQGLAELIDAELNGEGMSGLTMDNDDDNDDDDFEGFTPGAMSGLAGDLAIYR